MMKIDMVDLIIGVALGFAGGAYAKDKILGTGTEAAKASSQSLENELSDENEKLRKRIKDAERQIEDLLAENQKLRKSSKSNDDDLDDLQDELDDAKSKIKKLTVQNDDLLRKISEYKNVCQNYEDEIEKLKKA